MKLLSPKELSEILNISVGTLQRWRLASPPKGPRWASNTSNKRGRKIIWYDENDVEVWIERQKIGRVK